MIDIIFIAIFIVIVIWLAYNIPIAYTGLTKSLPKAPSNPSKYPKISIIVPAKDEKNVIGRCIESLLKLTYPRDKMEIIVVDGSSNDGTYEIAKEYESKYQNIIKVLRESNPTGKPSALNLALKHASGEIIAVFDADSIPSEDVLLKAVYYLVDCGEEAIQGRVKTVNSDENLLTRIIALEERGWFTLLMRGREIKKLFIPFTGNCLFIKKRLLEKIGGWRDGDLTEDLELSIRMFKEGYRVRYADDIVTLQEAPSKLRIFFSQRIRWFRGYIENALRYGSLLKSFNRLTLDAEMLLFGPFVAILSLISYFSILIAVLLPTVFIHALPIIILINILTLLSILIVLIADRPITLKKALALLSIQPYWFLQSFIALKALIDILLHRPGKWVRTTKTGRGINIGQDNPLPST